MSTLELQQVAGLGAVGLVLIGVVVGLVRWSRALNAIFPDAAKKYGLTFAERSVGDFVTGTGEHLMLQGETKGVKLEVVARRENRGRSHTRSTTVTGAVHFRVRPCTLTVSRERPRQTMHLVPTGDATFDRLRFVTCDAPEVVRVALSPQVRAAVLRCPHDELRLTITGEHVVLSWPSTPFTALELHAPIDLVLAMAAADRSAQPVLDTPRPQTAAERGDDAAAAARSFGFRPEHLEANRQGRLHPEQLAALKGRGRGDMVGFLLAAVLFAGAGVAGGIYNYTDRMAPTVTTFAVPALFGMMLAGACGAGFFWARGKRRAHLEALATGRPQVVEGPVTPWMVHANRSAPAQYGFRVGWRTFPSGPKLNALLTPGAYYRVYFLLDVVLGLEPTRGVEPGPGSGDAASR